jgi:hypothetical protein
MASRSASSSCAHSRSDSYTIASKMPPRRSAATVRGMSPASWAWRRIRAKARWKPKCSLSASHLPGPAEFAWARRIRRSTGRGTLSIRRHSRTVTSSMTWSAGQPRASALTASSWNTFVVTQPVSRRMSSLRAKCR